MILFKGTVLGPAEIGLLATVGATRVEVHFFIFLKKDKLLLLVLLPKIIYKMFSKMFFFSNLGLQETHHCSSVHRK